MTNLNSATSDTPSDEFLGRDCCNHELAEICAVSSAPMEVLSVIEMLRQPSANDETTCCNCRVADGEIPKQRDRDDCSPKRKSLCARGDPVHAIRERQSDDCARHQREKPSNLSLEAAGMNDEEDESGTRQQRYCREKCPNPVRQSTFHGMLLVLAISPVRLGEDERNRDISTVILHGTRRR